MSKILNVEDVVGKTVCEVYCTEWDIDIDGFGARLFYVDIGGDIVVELRSNDECISGLIQTELSMNGLFPYEDRKVVGEKIVDVLRSDFWPTVGLLLTDRIIICTGESEFRRVGPITLLLDGQDFRSSNYSSVGCKNN